MICKNYISLIKPDKVGGINKLPARLKDQNDTN